MKYLKIDSPEKLASAAAVAAETLRNGGVIAYPTDTLYGLGVDMNNEKALQRLYLLKKRQKSIPISAMVHSIETIENLLGGLMTEILQDLRKLLPGPVTVLLANTLTRPLAAFKAEHKKPPLRHIGFRIPDHPFCRELTALTGFPISTTSANLSGKKDVANVQELIAHFGDKLDLVIDGGPLTGMNGSTIIDFTRRPYLVIREGARSLASLKKDLGRENVSLRKTQFTIRFICTGNICRSPLAAAMLMAILQKTRYRSIIKVDSAGTMDLSSSPAHELTRQVAREQGLDVKEHRSRQVNSDLVDEAELIIALARNHYDYLRRHFPDQREKIVLLRQWQVDQPLSNPSIPDPVGHNIEYYRQNSQEIREEIQRILPFLLDRIRQFAEYNEITV